MKVSELRKRWNGACQPVVAQAIMNVMARRCVTALLRHWSSACASQDRFISHAYRQECLPASFPFRSRSHSKTCYMRSNIRSEIARTCRDLPLVAEHHHSEIQKQQPVRLVMAPIRSAIVLPRGGRCLVALPSLPLHYFCPSSVITTDHIYSRAVGLISSTCSASLSACHQGRLVVVRHHVFFY